MFALQTSAVSTPLIAQPPRARVLCLWGIYFLVVAFLTDEAKEGDLQRSQSSWHTEFIPGPSLDVLWGKSLVLLGCPPSCCPGRRSVSCSPSEMWLIAQEGQRSKTRRSQPAGLSPERSRWLSGFFVRYSLEKHPKFLLDGEMRNVSRVAVTSLSWPGLVLARDPGLGYPGWSFHGGELLGKGEKVLGKPEKSFFDFFFVPENRAAQLLSRSPRLRRVCSRSECRWHLVALQILTRAWERCAAESDFSPDSAGSSAPQPSRSLENRAESGQQVQSNIWRAAGTRAVA